MRAFIRNEEGKLALKSLPLPIIKEEDDILIQMNYSTICRDDMRVSNDLDIFRRRGIVGHEGSGTISAVGPHAQANGFSIGDRVVLYPLDFCGKCTNCLNGLPQYCPEARLSIGTLAEYIIKKPHQLLRIPQHLSHKQASLMEPIGDIIEALSRIPISFKSRCLIIGSGFTGLSFIRLLKRFGVKEIVAIEPIEIRRNLAIQSGANLAFSPDDRNLAQTLMKKTKYNGFDIVIETSANFKMVDFAIPQAAKGGTLLLFTYYGSQQKLSFHSLNMYASNLTLLWSSLCSLQSMRDAADLINQLHLDELITAEYSLNNVEQAFKIYQTEKELKIGIQF